MMSGTLKSSLSTTSYKTEHLLQSNLDDFLSSWDAAYKTQIKDIDLFHPSIASQYTAEQMQYFVKIFYHSRGHFKDFLWHLGNHAPNDRLKQIILKNIEEEFNNDCLSHEQMYLNFAKKMKVDLTDVILKEDCYLPEIRAFNNGHVQWMYKQPWPVQFAAFSAYERLDTTDYEALTALFPEDHVFFRIHREAKHFDKTYQELVAIWDEDPGHVHIAFDYIAKTQTKMWKDMANAMSKA
jgi:hypothetical protein